MSSHAFVVRRAEIDYQHDPAGSRVSVRHPCGKANPILLQGEPVAFFEKKSGLWVPGALMVARSNKKDPLQAEQAKG